MMKTRIPRIYISHKLSINQNLYLPEEHVHYIKYVLRMKIQNILEIFNNTNYVFFASIIYMQEKKIKVTIFEKKYIILNLHCIFI